MYPAAVLTRKPAFVYESKYTREYGDPIIIIIGVSRAVSLRYFRESKLLRYWPLKKAGLFAKKSGPLRRQGGFSEPLAVFGLAASQESSQRTQKDNKHR